MAYLNNSADLTTAPAVATEYQGIWQRTGYGDVVEITDQGGTRYEHTRKTCVQAGTATKAGVAKLFTDTELSDDGNAISVTPNPFQLFSWHIDKLNDLPTLCQPDNLTVGNTPTDVFEHLWHTFNDYYAFFAERGVDWDKQYTQFRPSITDDMSDDDLLDVIGAMLTPLDDGHIQLITADDDFEFSKKRGFEKFVMDTFQNQTAYTEIEHYVEALGKQWLKIKSSYFDANIGGSAGGSSGTDVEWAVTTNNVGYLYIGTMQDLTSDESDSSVDILDTVNQIMESALADLNNTDALIIDVRFNGGGYDAVSLAFANYFTDQPGPAYSKYARNFSGDLDTAEAFFSPATESPYLKPIIIISSELTASAAEVFLIIMSSLPHVTLMGEHSAGILADTTTKALPNNWKIRVPNVVFMDTNGDKYEVIGVPPEIDAPTNIAEMFDKKKDAAIEAALIALGY